MSTANTTPAPTHAKGVPLKFDPRYVEWIIESWLTHDLAPAKLDDFIATATTFIMRRLVELNTLGLREENVSANDVTLAIGLLQNLGLLQKKKVTPPRPRVKRGKGTVNQPQSFSTPPEPAYYLLAPTSDGREILMQPMATDGLRPHLVSRLVAKSPELLFLLTALELHDPFIIPVRRPIPGAPTRGTIYTRAVEDGLAEFRIQASLDDPAATQQSSSSKRPTAAQLIANAAGEAARRHPVGSLKKLDSLIVLAVTLGLVWTDTRQVNEVLAAQYIGLAASRQESSFAPNVPTWQEARGRFMDALVAVHRACANGSGYATIESIRGGLGESCHLSARVVDALIAAAREAGDRGDLPVLLHFEPDEEALYIPLRKPLIWRQHAFDFVEVRSVVSATHW